MARSCEAGSLSRKGKNSPPPQAKKSTPRSSGRGNPYASRGLDKFGEVLAELQSKRSKIMARARDEGVSTVRFRYSDSHDWVPIVVRSRQSQPQAAAESGGAAVTRERGAPPSKYGGGEGYYWAAVLVLILVCLTVSGRVSAVCCTAAYWYLAPRKMRRKTGDHCTRGMVGPPGTPRLQKKDGVSLSLSGCK